MPDRPPSSASGIECNICGSTAFAERPSQLVCASCGSFARTRLTWLLLTRRGLLRPGIRVLHLAPEQALAARLRPLLGDGYEPADIDPCAYPEVPGTARLDLVLDAPRLPSGRYDLVIHSHVMEHVRGNVTAVLFHLHRALKADGRQLCSIPIDRDGFYREDLAELDGADASARFGQEDHDRSFGARDIARTLGMIFRLPSRYDLHDEFDATTLDCHAIHPAMRAGWSPSSVIVLEKDDLLLRA